MALFNVTAATISGAFAFGMILSLLGSVKLSLAKRFDIDETRMGGLLSALNLALIPMMLLSGLLIDVWGARQVLILGSLVAAVMLGSLPLNKTYNWALLCILGIGVGGACLSTSSIVLMPQAFFEKGREAAALNLGNVFFGLGALITPALADLLLRTVRFRWTLGLLALLCLVPALVATLAPGEQFQTTAVEAGTLEAAGVEARTLVSLLSSPVLWLAALVFFLYGPIEFVVGTWTTTYLTRNIGFRERPAARLLSAFWLMFFASRLGMAFLASTPWLEKTEAWIIVLLALLAAVALGHLAGAATKGQAGIGLLFLGVCLGPVFPSLVGVLFRHSSLARGTAYGTLFAVGSLGSLFLAPLFGALASRRSVQRVLPLLLLLALGVCLAALTLALVAD